MGAAHTCDVKVTRRDGHKKQCRKPFANPVFTTKLEEVTKRNRQPHWECPRHKGHYKPVSALTGKPVERVVKSYRAVDQRLIPQRIIVRGKHGEEGS